MTSACVCTIDPPQLMLYAVLPVGVERRTPSPYMVVRKTSLTQISKTPMNSELPRVTVISLRAWHTAGIFSQVLSTELKNVASPVPSNLDKS